MVKNWVFSFRATILLLNSQETVIPEEKCLSNSTLGPIILSPQGRDARSYSVWLDQTYTKITPHPLSGDHYNIAVILCAIFGVLQKMR